MSKITKMIVIDYDYGVIRCDYGDSYWSHVWSKAPTLVGKASAESLPACNLGKNGTARRAQVPFFPRLQAMSYRSGTLFHHRYHIVTENDILGQIIFNSMARNVRNAIDPNFRKY